MPLDDDDADDLGSAGPPLPPDDRLWRHPSELRDHGLGVAAASSPAPRPAGGARAAVWPIVIVAALAGAALSTGVIAVTGALPRDVVERSVVEKVAMTPVVSSPTMRGELGVVAVAERLRPSIVRLDVDTPDGAGSGSGVIFRDDGMLLTSAHVVAGTSSISAVLTDGRRVEGRLVGLDHLTDVAVVDLEGEGFPVAVLGTADGLQVGAPAIAIGSPLGLEGGPSVTTGVVSAVGRRVDATEGEALHGMIQTDAPIAPGSSGGALVDANGAVVGVTSAVAADPSGRFGFATPIDLARRVADELIRTGHMAHVWLGVEGSDLTSEEAADTGLSGGAVVRDVVPDSPAAQAGLIEGDVVIGVDGKPVTTISALIVQLRGSTPGAQVQVRYWRAGTPREATVVLAEHP